MSWSAALPVAGRAVQAVTMHLLTTALLCGKIRCKGIKKPGTVRCRAFDINAAEA
jgi:hypothetical protein